MAKNPRAVEKSGVTAVIKKSAAVGSHSHYGGRPFNLPIQEVGKVGEGRRRL